MLRHRLKIAKPSCFCAGATVLLLAMAALCLTAPPAAGHLAATWQTETITSAIEIGQISIALDAADRPRLAFFDHSHFALRYAQSDGGGWQVETVADGSAGATAGERNSLRLMGSGDPRISYTTIFRSTHPPFSFYIDYASRTDAGWQASRVGSGSATALGIDPSGQPRVAYAAADGSLKYAWLDGAVWRQETVDPQGDLPLLNMEVAERPAIFYAGCNRLKYAGRSSAGWRVEQAEALDTTVCATPLAIADTACPRAGYYDNASGYLRFLRRRTTGWQREPALDARFRGSGFSLALDQTGHPHLSYSNDANRTIDYAWYDGAGWHSEVVDTTAYGYAPTALALGRDGQPRIAYAGGADQALRYARRLPQAPGGSGGRSPGQTRDSTGGAGSSAYIPMLVQDC